MEPLGELLKGYQTHSITSQVLENIKTVLEKNHIKFISIRLQNSTLIITVDNHMEATELRYKQTRLLTVLKPQFQVKTIKIHIM